MGIEDHPAFGYRPSEKVLNGADMLKQLLGDVDRAQSLMRHPSMLNEDNKPTTDFFTAYGTFEDCFRRFITAELEFAYFATEEYRRVFPHSDTFPDTDTFQP